MMIGIALRGPLRVSIGVLWLVGAAGRVRATPEIDGTASQSVTSYAVSEPRV